MVLQVCVYVRQQFVLLWCCPLAPHAACCLLRKFGPVLENFQYSIIVHLCRSQVKCGFFWCYKSSDQLQCCIYLQYCSFSWECCACHLAVEMTELNLNLSYSWQPLALVDTEGFWVLIFTLVRSKGVIRSYNSLSSVLQSVYHASGNVPPSCSLFLGSISSTGTAVCHILTQCYKIPPPVHGLGIWDHLLGGHQLSLSADIWPAVGEHGSDWTGSGQ